jgi:hypothetical protein
MTTPLEKSPFGTVKTVSRTAAAAIAATGSLAVGVPSDTETFRVERVEIMVDADYVADAVNFYVLTLQAGATVIATWSTQVGQEGTLTNLVPAKMTLSATAANLVLAAGTALKLVATKAAAAANITPRIVVHGRTVG